MEEKTHEEMTKSVLCAGEFEKKAYFFNEDYDRLPEDVKKTLREMCLYLTEKLHGLMEFGFYENGDVYISHKRKSNDIDFDQIGVELEIERLKKQEEKLFYGLTIWYKAVILKEIPVEGLE